MLPIVKRELQTAARRSWTYRQRPLIGGLALMVAVLFAISFNRSPLNGGAMMFKCLSWIAFIFALLDGVRRSSDAISWERREGTLGLLLLTPLRPRDIVLGKFSVVGIETFSAVLVALPVFALPLVMGGVTAGESARIMLTLMTSALFSLSCGLMISAISTSSLAALGGTMAFLLVITLTPHAVTSVWTEWAGCSLLVWISGPFGMLVTSPDSTYSSGQHTFWQAFAFCLLLSAGMLVFAGMILARGGSFDAVSNPDSIWQKLMRPRPGFTARWGQTQTPNSPALWLAERTLPGQRTLWLLITGGTITCFFIALIAPNSAGSINGVLQVLSCFGIKLWLGTVAPQSLYAARQTGSLELILCTPLRPAQLVGGQVQALFGYAFAPAMTICTALPIATIAGALVTGDGKGLEITATMLVLSLFWLMSFFLDLHALAYVGLWFGLTSVRAEQAIAKTLFMVLVVPWLIFLIPLIGIPLGIIGCVAWPIYCMVFGSNRLNRRFTEVVAEQIKKTAVA